MGDSECVIQGVCDERHKGLDREIVDMKKEMGDIRTKQDEYNTTIRNIYYTLLIIAFSTILTLAGVILGRAVDFHIHL
jgi:hypothetical protein